MFVVERSQDRFLGAGRLSMQRRLECKANALLKRLPTVLREEMRDLLIQAWRREAPQGMAAEFDAR